MSVEPEPMTDQPTHEATIQATDKFDVSPKQQEPPDERRRCVPLALPEKGSIRHLPAGVALHARPRPQMARQARKPAASTAYGGPCGRLHLTQGYSRRSQPKQ